MPWNLKKKKNKNKFPKSLCNQGTSYWSSKFYSGNRSKVYITRSPPGDAEGQRNESNTFCDLVPGVTNLLALAVGMIVSYRVFKWASGVKK